MNLDLGVRNNEDLKDAWIMVKALSDFIPEAKKTESCLEMIKKYKKAIRNYNKVRQDQHFISGDYDRYVMLIEFPNWVCDLQDAKQCFEEFYELHAYPSQYDCTGQHFTTGIKYVYRRGKWYGYHSISVDV